MLGRVELKLHLASHHITAYIVRYMKNTQRSIAMKLLIRFLIRHRDTSLFIIEFAPLDLCRHSRGMRFLHCVGGAVKRMRPAPRSAMALRGNMWRTTLYLRFGIGQMATQAQHVR